MIGFTHLPVAPFWPITGGTPPVGTGIEPDYIRLHLEMNRSLRLNLEKTRVQRIALELNQSISLHLER